MITSYIAEFHFFSRLFHPFHLAVCFLNNFCFFFLLISATQFLFLFQLQFQLLFQLQFQLQLDCTALLFLLQLPRSRPVCACQPRFCHQNILSHTSLSLLLCVCDCVPPLVNLDIFWLCMLSGCADTSSPARHWFKSFLALQLLLLQGVAFIAFISYLLPIFITSCFCLLVISSAAALAHAVCSQLTVWTTPYHKFVSIF